MLILHTASSHTHSPVLQVAPKRAALKGAQDLLAATMTKLAEAQAKLKGVEEKIEMLTKQFEEAMAKKEALAKQVGLIHNIEMPDRSYQLSYVNARNSW